jgi:hypothetical protein
MSSAADLTELVVNMRIIEGLASGVTIARSYSRWLSTTIRVVDHLPS